MSDRQNESQERTTKSRPGQPAYELRLLLICHAEEMHNRYSDLVSEDSGLTALGWQQTDALAGWLKSRYEIELLVSAPQLRNRLTAQRIGQAVGLPVTVHHGMQQRQQWLNASSTGDAVEALFAQLEESRAQPGRVESGLNEQTFCELLEQLLTRLQEEYGGKTVAIVMSARMISATLGCIFRAERLRVTVDHTGISELQLVDRTWRIACLNRREHVPMPAVVNVAPESSNVSAVDEALEDVKPVARIYNQTVTDHNMDNPGLRSRLEDLIRFAKLPPGMSLLDVGTGAGLLALALAAQGAQEVVGIDISPAMLERAEYLRLSSSYDIAQKVDFRLAAAQALPFRSERFDGVLCRTVLHLSRKPGQILREIARVLRPGGILVLADLLSADDPVKRATQNAIEQRRNPAHVAARTAQQYRELLEQHGFEIVSEEKVSFERELEEWLAEMPLEEGNGAVVRDMIEAGLETDAAGIKSRRQGETLIFEQRLFQVKARKA